MAIQIDSEKSEFLKGILAQGEARGWEKGREEGIVTGKAELLHTMVDRRFGTIPGHRRDAILAADTDQLDARGLRIFEADSLGTLSLSSPKRS